MPGVLRKKSGVDREGSGIAAAAGEGGERRDEFATRRYDSNR